jgi:site-specific DNA recombinase
VGEATYGYRSEPVGEMRVDRRGRPRPDGYRMVVYPPEAQVVLRLFHDFAAGKAITAIVRQLNEEEVPCRRTPGRAWTPSTVSRILKNEKYMGRWLWNRTETRRDPRTGRKRRFVKSESEWHVVQSEDLRIVPQDIWDRVTARWKEIDRTWPKRRGQRGFEGQQRSYVETHPPHLLSGLLRCGECGQAMGQVSGKAGGYYGCLGAAKRACTNKLLVPRRFLEKRILAEVAQRISNTAAVHYVLERVALEVKRLHAHLPEKMKLARAALAAEQRRVANYIGFIGEGKGTRALAEALQQAEDKVDTLRGELQVLTATADAVFQVPPVEWVAERLAGLPKLLERETARSALLLRRVLGPVRLVPCRPEVGRTYYRAETAIQVLELLEDPDGGSNSLRQWRRGESNPRPRAHPRANLRA